MDYSFLTLHFTTPQNHGCGMYMPSKKELMVLERKRGEFSERGIMMLHYVHGDLLKTEAKALVNAVNCVGVMGKGIALSFKRKFPENFAAYKLACYRRQVHPGKMFVFYSMDLFGNQKIIINFPTKKHWREKSELSYINDGLQDLIAVIGKYHIQSLALPPLGCGNGGLDWYDVKPLIERYLGPVSCDVYVYEPYGRRPWKNW